MSASILMIDDDEVDVFSMRRAIANSNLKSTFTAVSSSQYFLDEYRRDPTHKPDLILLDINMPGVGGIDLLRKIKKDKEWKNTPVMMLTTSDQKTDREESLSEGAACYLTKPSNLAEMHQILSTISGYFSDRSR